MEQYQTTETGNSSGPPYCADHAPAGERCRTRYDNNVVIITGTVNKKKQNNAADQLMPNGSGRISADR